MWSEVSRSAESDEPLVEVDFGKNTLGEGQFFSNNSNDKGRVYVKSSINF